MIIAIWGQGGAGKSVIANELGRLYAQHGNVTVVIDTDMTQPTLPPRLPKTTQSSKMSLGAIFSSTTVRDAQIYLHDHPKQKNLFFAGLTKDDDYLSYEIGMRQYHQAQSFTSVCNDLADVVILDCSAQRGDPFMAVATDIADHFILVLTPDTKNACWYKAVKRLLAKKLTDHDKQIIYVASPVQKHQHIKEYEKLTGVEFTAIFPFSKDINEVDGQGGFASESCDNAGRQWQRQMSILLHSISEAKNETV